MPIHLKDDDLSGLCRPAYRLTPRDWDAMDAILDPLLQGGQIEKVPLTAASPFASPAFVVWKNDKPRIIVDMRKLNTKVIPNAYPLPRQDAILDNLGGSIIFSSMDITKGFFQQPVAAEDTWKFETLSWGIR
ncbi:retrovirus-related Pol polyprotein [Trichophyton mentagrophytes]|nr:retrovirus-related Pol polyprotein [Trichophyton mentagrophytes]